MRLVIAILLVSATAFACAFGLSATMISRVITAHAREFRACYEQRLHDKPTLRGKVVVHFVIDGAGAVSDVYATSKLDDVVDACVVHQVTLLKFEATEATSDVNYPFAFSPQ